MAGTSAVDSSDVPARKPADAYVYCKADVTGRPRSGAAPPRHHHHAAADAIASVEPHDGEDSAVLSRDLASIALDAVSGCVPGSSSRFVQSASIARFHSHDLARTLSAGGASSAIITARARVEMLSCSTTFSPRHGLADAPLDEGPSRPPPPGEDFLARLGLVQRGEPLSSGGGATRPLSARLAVTPEQLVRTASLRSRDRWRSAAPEADGVGAVTQRGFVRSAFDPPSSGGRLWAAVQHSREDGRSATASASQTVQLSPAAAEGATSSDEHATYSQQLRLDAAPARRLSGQ